MSASHSVRERISIHAPRAGGDDNGNNKTTPSSDFNPRPPCGGRRLRYCTQTAWKKFQSTPPVRGATVPCGRPVICCGYFNPRPPCGGRPTFSANTPPTSWHFNPRPPCGGRRVDRRFENPDSLISIHAPRAGGDIGTAPAPARLQIFQSTPPVRGATGSFKPRSAC